jgi:beta,beta-carotene 9',10'-dioxygenase
MATTAPAQKHLLGFQTLEQEIALDALPVEGALPSWLAGSLVRTGPAKFEVGAQSLRHWFDGLAMLHRFSFTDGQVGYANRFLRTEAYRAATERGEIAFSEFATDPCRSLFKRAQTLFRTGSTDNCNVNVTRLGDELIAMTETPLPVAFDPRTLEAAGVAYSPPGQLTVAHPHHDPVTGELLSYAVHFGPRSTYRVYAQRGRTAQRVIATIPAARPAYMHSFGLTERFVVLTEFPLVVNPVTIPLSGRPFIENYRWQPERGTRFVLVDRATGTVHSVSEAEPFFAFHHVNAFERDGEVVVDVCAYEDDAIIRALYLDALRAGGPALPTARLRRYTVPLDGGDARGETLVAEPAIELPRIHYRRHNGRPYRFAYGAGAGDDSAFLDAIVKVDVDAGSATTWHEPGTYPGEPVFVPAPAADTEDDGVLLSVVLDPQRADSFLLVLDATDLREVARARVPHHIPFGFHGQFFG